MTSEQNDEAQSRPTRIAARVRWLLVAISGAAAVYGVMHFARQTATEEHVQSGRTYVCPMHPDITSPTPGACSICGMDLVPRNAKKTGPQKVHVPPAQRGRLGITIQPVRAEQVTASSRLPAEITVPPDQRAVVSARFSGFVRSVHANRVGETVRRGETIAVLVSPEAFEAQRDYITASLRSNATLSLGAQDPSAGRMAGAATQARAIAAARLEVMGFSAADVASLARPGAVPSATWVLRSPRGGTLTSIDVSQGSSVEAGAMIAEIVDLTEVTASVWVEEFLAREIQVGAPATVDSGNGARAEATVEAVEPTYDSLTRRRKLRLRIANPLTLFVPGATVWAEFSLAARRGIFVPRSAVAFGEESSWIFVEAPGDHFDARAVRLGVERGEEVEIVDGLRDGERIATSSVFLLNAERRLVSR